MDKAFYKFKDGSFGRSNTFRKGKYISILSVIEIGTNLCPFHDGIVSM
jgi:hypothetical protein